jgi:hypothetical protein
MSNEELPSRWHTCGRYPSEKFDLSIFYRLELGYEHLLVNLLTSKD